MTMTGYNHKKGAREQTRGARQVYVVYSCIVFLANAFYGDKEQLWAWGICALQLYPGKVHM